MKKRENTREILGLLLGATLAFALLLGGGLWLKDNLPRIRSERIEAELADGNYSAARRLAGRFRSEELALPYRQQCDYLEAQAKMETGDIAGAEALLAALGNYEDAPALLQSCRYELALQARDSGNWAEAIALFESLSGRDVLAELEQEEDDLAFYPICGSDKDSVLYAQ